MTSASDQMKRALQEIRRLRRELEEATRERAAAGAVAIIGAGLRLPGGIVDLPALEEALETGRNLVGRVPPGRWRREDLPADLGEAADHGAFVEDIDQFGPEFFGISGAEAASMDPQQRLLLEVGWEALEDAGHAPDSFSDRALGVFVGMANSDYGRMLLSDIPAIDPYFTSGSSFSVAAGRLAYFLGATGPAISVDTACSSSLVALHLARRSLIAGECEVALAGGVNLVLSPEVHVNFARAGMLAPDGRCKTFDAEADGYVRGEGCVLFTLRRLEDAVAGGDRILGVIRGSAVNQDGRSNGLTAPNGPAQEALIREALRDADVDPEDVGYVEAHGTGTSLGDPIELNALGRAYGRDRPNAAPLVVGSVKTNLGHLESAAGAAGVLKALLALRSGHIPAHLNFGRPNPHIAWPAMSLRVPAKPVDWPEGAERIAGVSSFGFSGTNAHLILGAAPAVPAAAPETGLPCHLFTLSAKSETALRTLAGRTATAASVSNARIGDICHTANAGRAKMPHRLAVAVHDADDLAAALKGFAAGQRGPGLRAGLAQTGRKPKVAFLFTGQGAQHPGMGRALYETQPVYREAIDACARALGDAIPGGLVAALHEAEDASLIRAPGIAQPALFALEYALARLWMSFGLRPDALCGHSLGEIVAATIAGVMSLEDALGLVVARGRLTARLAEGGMMASVFAPREAIERLLSGTDRVGIAAVNTPRNHVLSGPAPELQDILDHLTADGVRVEPLQIAFAAHCPLVDQILNEFREAARKIQYSAPKIPVVSNLTGGFTPESLASARHWAEHLRQPVRFSDGIATLLDAGITHFVEIGPHPVLSAMASECAELSGRQPLPTVLPSLRRDGEPGRELAESLGQLFVDGAPVDPDALQPAGGARKVSLPTYPFERSRHWHPSARPGGRRSDLAPDARWSRIAAKLAREAERGPLGFDAACPGGWEALGELTRARVVSLLLEAGLFGEAGARATLPEVVGALRARPDFEQLVERWLEELVGNGDLFRDGAAYVAPVRLDAPDLGEALAQAEKALAGNSPLMDYVRHCIGLVGPVIRGEASALETLFPGGDFDLALGLYERSTTMRYMNGLAAAAVEAMADTKGRALRILEAGAGTGGTTAATLDALTGRPASYLFTDVSDLFLDRARDRFRDREGLEFARFDLETVPAAQGIAPGSFDVVLASNAVHAVRNLPETLGHLRSLLRPGGMLVLIESTTHFPWFNVTTGLIEGWRHSEDDLRRDDLALIDAPTWLGALEAAGFDRADAWPGAGMAAETVGQHLIVARAPLDGEAGAEAPSPQVAEAAMAAGPDVEIAPFLDAIADALPRERPRAIGDLVRARVVRLLRRHPDQPPLGHERLLDLGLDSLMAVQLRNSLSQDLALPEPLPATLVFDHPTIDALSAYLDTLQAPRPAATGASAARAAGPAPTARTSEIEAMSDEEVEALLLERLNR